MLCVVIQGPMPEQQTCNLRCEVHHIFHSQRKYLQQMKIISSETVYLFISFLTRSHLVFLGWTNEYHRCNSSRLTVCCLSHSSTLCSKSDSEPSQQLQIPVTYGSNDFITTTTTNEQPFNGSLSGTTQRSQQQNSQALTHHHYTIHHHYSPEIPHMHFQPSLPNLPVYLESNTSGNLGKTAKRYMKNPRT